MPYLLAIFLVAVIAVFVGMFSVARSQTTPTKTTSAVERSETGSTTRSDIKARLDALARSEAPQQVSPGAMCYSVATEPMTVDYVCPECGEKTLYSRTPEDEAMREYKDTGFIRTEIAACRRLVTSIEDLKTEGLRIELDESQFCAKCSPDLTEPPKLVLVVHYEGEEQAHRVEDVTADDLRLIHEFLSGEDTHKGERDSETPLKDHLERLRQLLGTEAEAPAKQESGNDE